MGTGQRAPGKWHFISILGTGSYTKTHYYFENEKNGKTEKEVIEATPYIQDALLTHFKDELSRDGSRATIFVTKKSYDKNWQDHPLSQQSKTNDNVGADGDRSSAVLEEKGLYTILKEKFPQDIGKISEKEIPVGKNRDELWEIFDDVYNDIETGEKLVFDITHGLRSLPVLALAVLNYAATMKKCRISGIYYGAFDSVDRNDDSNKYSDGYYLVPVFDLTIYNEILRWSHAADHFSITGNPSEINDLLRESDGTETKEKKKKRGLLSDYTHSMKNLAYTLVMCRGKSMDSNKNNAKKSISSAYSRVLQIRETNASMGIPDEDRPFYQLVNKAEESFSGFNQTENYQIGLAAVAWYIKNNMIQPGYTALEETAKTYVCHHFGFPEDDEHYRDRIAGYAINKMNHYLKDKKLKVGCATEEDRDQICADILAEEKARETIRKIFEIIMKDTVSDMTLNDVDNIFWSVRNALSRYRLSYTEELYGTDLTDDCAHEVMRDILQAVSDSQCEGTDQFRDEELWNLMNVLSSYHKEYYEMIHNPDLIDKRNEPSSEELIRQVLRKLADKNDECIKNLADVQRVIHGLPFAYAQTVFDIKNYRNDLNHFGFNKDPHNADEFKNSLNKQYKDLKKIIDQIEENAV